MFSRIVPCLNDASDSCLIPGVEDGARSDGTLSEQYCRKCDLKREKCLKPFLVGRVHIF